MNMRDRISAATHRWLCACLLAGCGVASPLGTDAPDGEADAGAGVNLHDAPFPDATPPRPDAGDDVAANTGSGSRRRPACGMGSDCDPTDLGGESCASLGLGGGMLLCDPTSCTFVLSLCLGLGTDIPRLGPPCGTGPGCDPADLGDASCDSLGLGEGVLSCDPLTCMFDTSMCERPGSGMGGTTGAFGGGGFLGGLFGTGGVSGGAAGSDAGPP